ncbi:MAG: FAD-binding oxidoreductase [Patulibacter sp.]
MPSGELLAQLQAIVGRDHAFDDAERCAAFERDATGRFGTRGLGVVRPGDAGEVAQVLRLCVARDVAVVPQGGNTGLSGGGVPQPGELVLSLARLNRIEDPDPDSHQLVVGAGATLEAVQRRATDAGLEFPLDFPARGSATIGGMVATNAAGSAAMRWGSMRAHVRGMQVVLADGRTLTRIGGVPKDNAGFDWPALVTGSEGTLAVVTAVQLQLRPRTGDRVAALIGVADYAVAVRLVSALRGALGDDLEAADFADRVSVETVLAHRELREPLATPFGVYLFLTVLGADAVLERLVGVLDEAGVADAAVAVADDDAGRTALWAYREHVNESLRGLGVVQKYDVSLPLRAIDRFATEAARRLRTEDAHARLFLFGHLGDGNLHVNVVSRGPHGAHGKRIDSAVLSLVGELGGSIDAEHGVGVSKRDHLGRTRGPDEISTMVDLKRALDPHGVLNPGRVLRETVRDAS